MDKKTLKALKASIVKWDNNAKARTPDQYLLSVGDCPLCAIYWDRECSGCPVFTKTQEDACGFTPYHAAVQARRAWRDGEGSRETALKAAEAEAAFLRSLLPEGETV